MRARLGARLNQQETRTILSRTKLLRQWREEKESIYVNYSI
jgi:hypothetical protein